jgi:hypothetical protein
MANSYVLYNGTGALQTLTVPFDYLDRDHVSVLVDGASVVFTWLSDTSVQATTTVGTANVRVKRTTPKDPQTIFSDGQGLTAADLNVQGLQLQYVSEESEDAYLENVLTDLSVDTTKIANDAVTMAKLSEMAARTVIANDTAGTANPTAVPIEDLTVLSDGSATRRDLSARFADVLHAKDFGVTADGTTDDTTAMLALAAAATNKRVYLGRGTIVVNSSIVWPRCAIYGDGEETTIKRGASFSSGLQTFYMSGVAGLVRDVTFNGNAPTSPAHTSSELAGGLSGEFLFENITIFNHHNIGIAGNGGSITVINPNIDGTNTPTVGFNSAAYGIFTGDGDANQIIGGRITNCYTSAIYGGGDTVVLGTFCENNHRQTAFTGGGQIAAASSATSMRVMGVKVNSGQSVTTGLELDNCPWLVSGCHIDGCPAVGIALQGDFPHRVVGNVVKNCGLSGIVVSAGVSHCLVSGNRCFDDQGSPTQDYGVEIEVGASDYLTITDNDLVGNVNAVGILNGATGTHNNIQGNHPDVTSTTFTPSLVGTGGGSAHTYTRRVGRYWKVGKRVFFTIDILLSAKDGTMTGPISISGLPATAVSTNSFACSIGYFAGYTRTLAGTQLGALVFASTSVVYLYEDGTQSVSGAVGAAFGIYLTGSYEAA